MKKTAIKVSCILILILITSGCSVLSVLSAQSDISGTWNGEVRAETGDSQQGVMKISKNDDGTFSGILIGEDISETLVDVITLTERKIHFEIPSFNGIFDGEVDESITTIKGEWLINNAKYDVLLKKE